MSKRANRSNNELANKLKEENERLRKATEDIVGGIYVCYK